MFVWQSCQPCHLSCELVSGWWPHTSEWMDIRSLWKQVLEKRNSPIPKWFLSTRSRPHHLISAISKAAERLAALEAAYSFREEFWEHLSWGLKHKYSWGFQYQRLWWTLSTISNRNSDSFFQRKVDIYCPCGFVSQLFESTRMWWRAHRSFHEFIDKL